MTKQYERGNFASLVGHMQAAFTGILDSYEQARGPEKMKQNEYKVVIFSYLLEVEEHTLNIGE